MRRHTTRLVRLLVSGIAVIALGWNGLPAKAGDDASSPGTSAPAQGEIPKTDRPLYKRMLADIRKDLETHYYDKAFRGVDLDGLFRETTDKLAAAASTAEAVELIAGTLFRFGDSHTRFIPPVRATRVNYGWTMAAVGEKVLVLRVDPQSDAEKSGLAPGDQVLAVNRFQPTRENLWQIHDYYGTVRPQVQQHLVVRKPDGTERALDVKSRVERRELVQLTDAIEEEMVAALREADFSRDTEPGILVWRMSSFGESDDMGPFVAKARKADALVLDLRGNSGGLLDGLKALVGWTFDREVHVMTTIGRKGERREIAKPRGKPFAGKLVVLVDSRSASAAECFARIVQIEKRGTVVGDRTSGRVMTSATFMHDFGIGTQTYYGVSVTLSDVRMADGGRLENLGVTPDRVIVPTPADLAARRDPVLAAALSMLGSSLTPEQAAALMTGKK